MNKINLFITYLPIAFIILILINYVYSEIDEIIISKRQEKFMKRYIEMLNGGQPINRRKHDTERL